MVAGRGKSCNSWNRRADVLDAHSTHLPNGMVEQTERRFIEEDLDLEPHFMRACVSHCVWEEVLPQWEEGS